MKKTLFKLQCIKRYFGIPIFDIFLLLAEWIALIFRQLFSSDINDLRSMLLELLIFFLLFSCQRQEVIVTSL